MDYGLSDSSGTDDDLPPPHRNRFQRGGRTSGSMRPVMVGAAPLPAIHGDMEIQIHLIEQEAYYSVIRAFKAQSDAISWEKEGLITELRKELRVSDEEHRELLSRVNADDTIRRIREWRKANGLQPGMLSTSQPIREHLPSPTVSASRKKQKTSQSMASLSMGIPSPALHPPAQQSSGALRRGPPSVSRNKKPKASMQHPSPSPGSAGRPHAINPSTLGGIASNEPAEAATYDVLIGKKVWTRWPDDNNFYEAIITDYKPSEGRHALVYDIHTANETWEWVNLKEISPDDIRWEGEDPGVSRRGIRPGAGRGVKKLAPRGGSAAGLGRGRGIPKSQSKKDILSAQNGIGKKARGDIQILHTDTLLKEVERVMGLNHPDTVEIEKAKKVLQEHEQALVDAIAKLEDASDGESEGTSNLYHTMELSNNSHEAEQKVKVREGTPENGAATSEICRSLSIEESDHRGNQAQLEKDNNVTPKNREIGGWKCTIILLANQSLATLTFFGVGVNLVLFLTRVIGQENASAANSVSKWTGTVYLCSLIGAFLSDSYWGRYLTCTIFQVILVMGAGLLSVTASVFLLKPTGCGDGELNCVSASSVGVALFYLAIYLVALGYGGHQPTIATFGADQFDESEPKGRSSKAAFFCYFYFALNVGSLFSNTVLVYYEDVGEWTLGFLVSTGAAVLALATFLAGSRRYRYVKACGNPIPRVTQVFVAAIRKWSVVAKKDGDLYEVEGSASAIRGSRKILHSDEFGFMDKAATVTDDDMKGPSNPWRLCTVTQVEEAKCVVKMLPVWLCTIIYSVVFTQMASLFVEQGDVMNTKLGSFKLPAASMSTFDIFSVLICTGIYRQILVPLAGRLSRNPKGLTELQRMGIGLIIGMLAMVAAGATEIERLKHVQPGEKASSLSILWQIPQYVLVGASEVFMYVGQLEFFNGQAPDGIKSFGSSLCMASISLGNYVSSMLVYMVMGITARGESPGWIPENLNSGHMDRFYFLLAVLTAIDFVIYLFCARWYKPTNFDAGDQGVDEMEKEKDGVICKV
ncbi:hypothetical protein SAY86_032066 [Trapa natans]|uniref:ENT domain-containing protein n=1 Tax=Trapa natans TaxID=22666 RepID=A0AAN7LMU8_TRANT|nr:hypothetical protein SAY86_032066 [Trapa natans]